MLESIKTWALGLWRPQVPTSTLAIAYDQTFNTEFGRIVLQHLLDSVYCSVYSGVDPNAALVHNARRTVVHEILENIDRATNPLKYQFIDQQTQYNNIGERNGLAG